MRILLSPKADVPQKMRDLTCEESVGRYIYVYMFICLKGEDQYGGYM